MRALLVLALSGCGLGWIDGQDDLTTGLPTSGAGPYARLESDDSTPASEPTFHDDNRASVEDPSMLAGGPGVRVWFTQATVEPVTSEIRYIEAASLRVLPSSPETVLTASEAWEEGVVSAPSVLANPEGGLVMFYEGGVTTPSIGRAVSTDGLSWEKDPDPVLVGATSPSAVFAYGETWLFATRPGEVGIWRAVDAGSGFAFDAAAVIVPRSDEEDAFDRLTVAEPFALAVQTLDDDVTRIHLWFAGTTDLPNDATSIGYAASFDGVEWLRFGGLKPMLAAEATAPTVVLEAAGGSMLFAEPSGGASFELNAASH
ncbi:MAG: hypothetical protein H0V17_25160 [Deltaproteobacteria bacterium]|nr:hypothetical protein [Deltaproteobacteria bacterium]